MHEKALQQEFMKLISAMRRDGDLFVDACGFALGAPHAEPYAVMLPAIIGEENGFFNLNVEDAEYLAHALLECAQEAVKLTQHTESEYAAHLAISKSKKGRLCNG